MCENFHLFGVILKNMTFCCAQNLKHQMPHSINKNSISTRWRFLIVATPSEISIFPWLKHQVERDKWKLSFGTLSLSLWIVVADFGIFFLKVEGGPLNFSYWTFVFLVFSNFHEKSIRSLQTRNRLCSVSSNATAMQFKRRLTRDHSLFAFDVDRFETIILICIFTRDRRWILFATSHIG